MTSVSLSREREIKRPVPYFCVEVAPDFAHPVVVMLKRPVRIFVLQFDLRELPPLKLKSVRFNPGWINPSTVQISVPSFVSRPTVFRFRALQDLLDPTGRIIPAKAKRRRNFVRQAAGRNEGKSDQGRR